VNIKNIIVAIGVFCFGIANAQEVENDSIKPIGTISIDSLQQEISLHQLKFDALNEQLSPLQEQVDKIAKLKISGYIQAQYETYDTWNAGIHGVNPVTGAAPSTNTFSLRRARVKFTYEPIDGVKFVLCPNFEIDRVRLTDVYVMLNDRWTNTFSLWVGLFNRPTYEVEFSSASREFAERSLFTRILYPQERDQGAKLEANFMTKYEIPLKLQVAVLNGNFGTGGAVNQVKDVDNSKDIMARAVYSLKFPSQSLGIDFGGLGYFGNNEVITQTATPAIFTDENGNKFTPKVGDNLKKEWYGAEMQVYYDFLGGTSFKTEYIRGALSGFKATDFPTQVNTLFTLNNKVRDIEGYYFSLIKNIGIDHMLSVRYDVFDPNTKKSGNEVGTIDDLKFKNWTFAYQYFFDENVKIMLSYTMPLNEKSANPAITNPDFANIDHVDNSLTLRFQAKF
jgi:phosphate-selective porin